MHYVPPACIAGFGALIAGTELALPEAASLFWVSAGAALVAYGAYGFVLVRQLHIAIKRYDHLT